MKRRIRSLCGASLAGMLAVALAAGLSACGGGSANGNGGGEGEGGKGASSSPPATLTVVEAGFPETLDPQVSSANLSMEATWNVYLGLYTYAHASGDAGSEVIPALAEAAPKISDGGKTYSITLRKGLTFSNGAPVKASDFVYAAKRAIKLNWGNKSFFTEHVAGAEAFDKGKASSISGIKVDDSTGAITIHLTEPYGPFLNVLSFPALGLVPKGTPMKAMPNDPPPGVGPYVIANVKPGRSFEEQINPKWASQEIPGIPAAHANILVKVQSNASAEADEVLSGEADLYDWNSPLPPSAIQQAEREASGRYKLQPVAQTTFFFLNVSIPPFNSLKARQAVITALNRPAFQRLASGYLKPGCYLVPPGIVGHPSAPCPYGAAESNGDLSKAKQLLEESGQKGAAVKVWGLSASPAKEFTSAFTQMLKSIGFNASEQIISPEAYFPTITSLKTKAQAGFAEYSQDFPNPVDFYQLIDGAYIQPEGNPDLSVARDPAIEKGVEQLGATPASQLPSIAGRWEALERHTAKQAYMAVIGYSQAPELTSSRVNFGALVFSPVYGPDWTTLQLK